ncbi:MAG: IclR family transcriptional regulator [Pseudomonadota bacterium]
MAQTERIPTNLRTLLILEVLGKSDQPMTATEINEQIGLPKQTVHRLCTTLERTGFLTRQGNSKRYHTARRLRDLGAGLLFNSRFHIARRQILLDVARQVRETVNFVVPEASGMSYLDRVETDWMFRIQLPIGTHVPFHATASGKCFLASLAPRARRHMVASLTLSSLTSATRTSPTALLDDLARIADRGYSLDEEEFLEGMVAIAVPISDSKGRFMAALAYHGPTQRMSLSQAIEDREILTDAATRLQGALYHEG